MSRSRRFARPALLTLEDRCTPALSFFLDFSRDQGFFRDHADRKALAQQAADALAAKFSDSLAAVTVNSATAVLTDPANTDAKFSINGLSVPADTLYVFVAGGPLDGQTAGLGGPTFGTSGYSRLATSSDFAPLAAFVCMDNDGTSPWDFTTETGKTEFKGVFTHELIHGMGIVSSQPSWTSHVSNFTFTGPRATTPVERNTLDNGTVVPGGHPESGARSIMVPDGAFGEINDLTPLDLGLLQDIGWTLKTTTTSKISARPLFTGGETFQLVSNIDLGASGGVVLYRIDAFAGYKISFSTRANGNGNLDTYMRLFDRNGNQVTADDDGGTDSFSSIDYDVPSSGPYFLGVSLYANRTYDVNAGTATSATGKFALAGGIANTVDVGNEMSEAREVVASDYTNGKFEKGETLADEYDIDMYKVTLSQGQTLGASTSFYSGAYFSTDTYVRLFDSNGRQLLARDDGGGGNYGSLSYTASRSGTYYVGVSHSKNRSYDPNPGGTIGGDSFRGGGDYKLTLTLSSGSTVTSDGGSTGTYYADVISRAPNGTWFAIQNSRGSSLVGTVPYGQWNEAAGWRDVLAGDFSGDGVADRIGRAANGAWFMAKNTGLTFVNVPLGSWNEAAGWRDVVAGNFGGSAALDVAGRAANGGWWVSITGPNGFVSTTAYVGWNEAAGWRDVRAVDWNKDGLTDIIGRAANGSWWLNRNTGSSFVISNLGAWNEGAGWRDVRVADFTGDGLPDIAGRTSAGQWWVSPNVNGTSITYSAWGNWNEAAGWRSVMVGDFAGDSRPDIIGRAANGAWWVLVTTNGGFTHQGFGGWNEAAGWTDVMAGNFSGGAKADIIARAANGQWWIGNNQQPTFNFTYFTSWSPVDWRSTTVGHYVVGRSDGGATEVADVGAFHNPFEYDTARDQAFAALAAAATPAPAATPAVVPLNTQPAARPAATPAAPLGDGREVVGWAWGRPRKRPGVVG